MSGHSKWATTKHRKAAQDAKRSALFSKLSRNITVAAKEGGDPNPENNASLAAAIEKAKGYSLPKDKIKVAIDKAFGTGKDAANYETVVYEGYGPAGVAVYCEALTDNRNRTAADVRSAFSHAGGNLGTSGSVAYMFERKGQVVVAKEVETGDKKNPVKPNGAAADEDEFMMAVAEAGGDDYEDAEDEWVVYTAPTDLMAVKSALEEQGIETKGAEMIMVATTPATVSVTTRRRSCASSTSSRSSRIFRTSTTPWISPTRSPRLSTSNVELDHAECRSVSVRSESRKCAAGIRIDAGALFSFMRSSSAPGLIVQVAVCNAGIVSVTYNVG